MTDDSPPRAPARIFRRGLGRLQGRRAILAASALALLLLALLARLAPLDAVIAFAAILVIALVVPGEAERAAAGPPDAVLNATRAATLRAFADALADPCIVLDRRSVVAHVNPAAAAEFPTTRPGEPVGMSLRLPGLLAAIEAARASGTLQTAELHRAGPAESWHRLDVAPLHGANAGILLLTLRNQTGQKRIEALRTDFIANASHELRTPLTSLVGFIDTLLGPAAGDAAARERFLTIMRTQAARMSKLIDDLLSLSRIEMRQHLRPTGRVDLRLLLREVTEGLQTQAESAGVTVEGATPGEPAIVTGERDELYEVFENLLDNAIKYGGGGGRVDIRLGPATRPGFDYAVEVIDYGAGIALEHVPRLTERFYRVDAEFSRKKKGTGLGLAIVKHIINRHRGSLAIRSEPGTGTRVEVLLLK